MTAALNLRQQHFSDSLLLPLPLKEGRDEDVGRRTGFSTCPSNLRRRSLRAGGGDVSLTGADAADCQSPSLIFHCSARIPWPRRKVASRG